MTFKGWDVINPYTIEQEQTKNGWLATVRESGEAVFITRPCRLEAQAERLAIDWIQRDAPNDGVSLDVQNMSVDADTLFTRSKQNG